MEQLRTLYLPRRSSLSFAFSGCERGFSLLEVMIVTGVMGFMVLAMLTMQSNQLKSNNYLEFQLKRTQLQNALIGQVLNDPLNCSCLFAGASAFAVNPTKPGATLTGVAPTQIGRYQFVTPGDCSTATIPQPLVDGAGIDGLKTTSIQLKDIMNVSGAYSGSVVVNLESTKEMLGPKTLAIKIPVSITTAPSGSNVKFVSCSLGATSAAISNFELANLDAPISGTKTLAVNQISTVKVVSDSTVKAVTLGITYSGSNKDTCLGVMNVSESNELYHIGGRSKNGEYTDAGGVVIAPVDSNGYVHVSNSNSGGCNEDHKALSFSWMLIALHR